MNIFRLGLTLDTWIIRITSKGNYCIGNRQCSDKPFASVSFIFGPSFPSFGNERYNSI